MNTEEKFLNQTVGELFDKCIDYDCRECWLFDHVWECHIGRIADSLRASKIPIDKRKDVLQG